VPGQPEPLTFETESTIAVAAAQLVEVKTVWPARDAYADHTHEYAGGRPFTLFEPLRPVSHALYLAHDTLFALTGQATVEIEFELSTPGSAPLDVAWEHWDGQVWRPFREFDAADPRASRDGTAGLTRSGIVTLRAECGPSQKTTVNGVEAYWVRGRLSQPLPPDPARVLPEVDRIRVRSAIERPAVAWEVDQRKTGGSLAVHGTIRDQNGDPLQGAKVVVIPIIEGVSVFVPPIETDDQGRYKFEIVNGGTYQVQVLADLLLPAGVHEITVGTSAVQVDFQLTLGPLPDRAFGDGLPLDVSKTFYPLGQQPQAGSTFYFSSEQVFGKPGATMVVWTRLVPFPPASSGAEALPLPQVLWEYWNGSRWAPLALEPTDPQAPPADEDPTRFKGDGIFTIRIPANMAPVDVNGQEALWMRARLTRGGYGLRRETSFQGPPDNAGPFSFSFVETVPPAVAAIRLGVTYRSPWERPQHCHGENDFRFAVHSDAARGPGDFFFPFRSMADVTPALYLGFDRPLPNDLVTLYLDVQERDTEVSPLLWEAWDGTAWRELAVGDETAALRRPGIVSLIAPAVAPRPQAAIRGAGGDQVFADALEIAVFEPGDPIVVRQNGDGELATVRQVVEGVLRLETPLAETYAGGTVRLAALPRFGTPRDWVRARLKADGAPAESRLNGLYLNAAWALQRQTVEDELLGSSSAEPDQVFFFTQVPVLPGEAIEVRELSGARAQVELPLLREELLAQGSTEDDVRTVRDPRTGRVTEVWVRWQARPHLYFSGPDERHYVVERAGGRLIFGDGRNGRIPPAGANNVRARRYRSGGGVAGNVPAGTITQLLGAAPFVQEVTNPRPADGGADGELPEQVTARGPRTLRHRGRALSARDYEALAREASPGLAAARALPATAPNGRPAPGWVTVIIVPQSAEPQPFPSFELRRRVQAHLAARAPATLAGERIGVIGPTYLPIGLNATVIPRDVSEAGRVRRRVEAAAARFLHPLTGGPEGRGWPFGRDVYQSDVAALLEGVAGVDYIAELVLLLDDTPQGERVPVPPVRIVVAGPVRIVVQAAEDRRAD
jgi:hypothetical protein